MTNILLTLTDRDNFNNKQGNRILMPIEQILFIIKSDIESSGVVSRRSNISIPYRKGSADTDSGGSGWGNGTNKG